MPLYTSTGALNVVSNDTTKGRYTSTGALRINLVTGTSYVGLYAADGALNVIDVTGTAVSTYGGLYHPSGAIRGRTAPNTYSGLQAPDGSYYFNGLFSPLNLFSAGEQGVWYDPSDFSTMFQDNAGTTPVTAVEQTVGLLLDKSKSLSFTELVTNGAFDSATGWTLGSGWAIGSGALTGTSIAVAGAQALFPCTIVAGRSYRTTFTLSAISANGISLQVGGVNGTSRSSIGTYSEVIVASTTGAPFFGARVGTTTVTIDNVSVVEIPVNSASQATLASRPTLSARVNQLLATATLATQNVTTLAATYTLAFSGTGTVTASGTNVGVYSAGSNSLVCTAGTLTLTVSGSVTLADLRVTNDGVGLPAYQAVVTSTNYDTVGFPLYLRFDGSNDSLATGSINFSTTDKMSVFAGVRKLSDAARALIVELGSGVSSFNTFNIQGPGTAGAASYIWRSAGSTTVDQTITTYTSPITSVITGIGDIAAPVSTVRVNGAQVASSTSSQGTGAYSNAALYIGRRGGTTLPFNGNLYSLIIRGAQSTNAEIASTEIYVNTKTKAY